MATQTDTRSRIVETAQYLQTNLAGELDLEHLACRAGLSPHHFHRLFRGIVGEPPRQFVRRLRLESGAAMLKHTSRPVCEVALRVGYDTHESFTRAFRTRFGLPPQAFRRSLSRPDTANLDARIVRLPPTRIAFVRHVGPYDDGGSAFGGLRRWAAPRGLLDGMPLITLYWDDQDVTAPRHLRCEAALPVPDHVHADVEVGVRTLPGGEHAVVRHRGSYAASTLQRAYALAYGWVLARGRQVKMAPPFEMSESPSLTADGGETLLHIPLVSRAA